MTIYYGFTPGCEWSYHFGAVIQTEWDAWIKALAKHIRGPTPPRACVVFVKDPGFPSASQRKQLVEEVLALPGACHYVGRAYISNSHSLRVVVRAFEWLQPIGHPQCVFEDGDSAFAWLGHQVPYLDLRSVAEDVRAKVPTSVLQGTRVAPPWGRAGTDAR